MGLIAWSRKQLHYFSISLTVAIKKNRIKTRHLVQIKLIDWVDIARGAHTHTHTNKTNTKRHSRWASVLKNPNVISTIERTQKPSQPASQHRLPSGFRGGKTWFHSTLEAALFFSLPIDGGVKSFKSLHVVVFAIVVVVVEENPAANIFPLAAAFSLALSLSQKKGKTGSFSFEFFVSIFFYWFFFLSVTNNG